MTRRRSLTAVLLLLASLYLATAAVAQQRDHLTPLEVDRVKEAQILDKRIEVFIKATDRRLMVLTGTQASNAKQLKKDAELWGDLPIGSQAELISDIAKILDEAITNIDDVSARDDRNPLIAKSLRRLAQAVNSITTQLAPFRDKVKTDAEVASLELLSQDAEQILAAVKKLPPEVEKKGKSKN